MSPRTTNGRMEPRSLAFVGAASGAVLQHGSPETLVQGVCCDSRQVQPGDLFVALTGERFDGHQFVAEAAQRGAVAALVTQTKVPLKPPGCALLLAEDSRRALGRLAAVYRRAFDLPVVAIGGSNGKTTTKNLVAAVLQEQFPTLASPASFNNDVGVPLTLLGLERTHRAAVVEVGTNHPGELEPLVAMVAPRLGVITNIGREHLEFFGDLAGVAKEEGVLAEQLPAEGTLFLNGDDPWTPVLAQRSRATVVRVGLGPGNDWRAQDVQTSESGTRFLCSAPQPDFCGFYRLTLVGRHQALNALFALAVGAVLGCTPEQARRGLARCPAPPMRGQLWQVGGVRVLDDSYNANADSMAAALQTLCELPCTGRRVAVLGDMAELGAHTLAAHEEVGQRAAQLGVDQVVAVGRWAAVTAAAARAAGLKQVIEMPDVTTAAAQLPGLLRPGDLVLLKASRVTGLDRVGLALRQAGADRCT